ncbi:hypothetical protein [Vulcanisaeta sp. JCM 16159]|uniref:hypothetical protein n=1 Tax=Vulcanisaeta sp. JCM 16159 TaxID=1295371 RepID=UPI0034662449
MASRLGKSFDVVFIDHFMHFDETIEFINKVAGEWGLRLFIKGNDRLRALSTVTWLGLMNWILGIGRSCLGLVTPSPSSPSA